MLKPEQDAGQVANPQARGEQACLSAASGDPNTAVKQFEQAENSALEMNLRPFVWQACTGAAKALLEAQQDSLAGEKKEQAIAMINEIGGLFEDQEMRALYLANAIRRIK